MLALLVAAPLTAAPVPKNAHQYLPVLIENQRAIWPDAPMPSFLAAQVEQESCISLTHSKCWNPRAELKTSRENGIGFGQFTRAWRADGTLRFDKIAELAAAHKSLRGWSWENRYDARYQLLAIVEMDKAIYRRITRAATERDHLSFMLSAYNGGERGVNQDRRLCANTRGCDEGRWAGHVATTSLKSKRPHPGYRQSFFDINRGYVTNVLDVRRAKYIKHFEQ